MTLTEDADDVAQKPYTKRKGKAVKKEATDNIKQEPFENVNNASSHHGPFSHEKKIKEFNQQYWGSVTAVYVKSLKHNRITSPKRMQEIVDDVLSTMSSGTNTARSAPGSADDDTDPRMNIIEDSDW